MAAGGGVPWAEGVRVVGLQIRNRFRVAPVDRRWLWRRPEGRAASEAVRQWSDRVRALVQRDKKQDQGSASPDAAVAATVAAKPSSSAMRFYKKKGIEAVEEF
jgi:monolysocardiolipin acyltransferase